MYKHHVGQTSTAFALHHHQENRVGGRSAIADGQQAFI
jgi:hypothetical protein